MCKFKLFSIAAAALMMVACSTEDLTQQTQIKTGEMHFTATIAAPSGTTRTTYEQDGDNINVKWVVGDEIALVHNKVKDVAKVKSISSDGTSATIEGILTGTTDELNGADVQLYYPAARISGVTSDGNPVFDGSVEGKISSQDGTPKYIQDNLDFRVGISTFSVNGSEATLKEAAKMYSQIAIWKLKLKDNASALLEASKVSIEMGSGDYTTSATATLSSPNSELTIATQIPPAIDNVRPITIEATVGNNTYVYKQDNVDVTPGKYYQSTVKMEEAWNGNLATVTKNVTATDGTTIYGTLAGNYKISIAAGATVTLAGVTINGANSGDFKWAGITCEGDATIILKDETTNTVKGFYATYPGVHVLPGKTLIIKGETLGTGKLIASSNVNYGQEVSAAGIGGGSGVSCGNIEIQGGDITATGGYLNAGIGGGCEAACGTITISGGTINATGGEQSAGIGSGYDQSSCVNIYISGGTITAMGKGGGAGIGSGDCSSSCGTITITDGVTKVTATAGQYSPNSIGAGAEGSSCGTVTIGGKEGAITTSPYIYPAAAYTMAANATAGDVGKLICTDGHIHAYNADAACTKSRVAKIIYVGSSTGDATYNHGLALALTDESSGMDWNNAKTACTNKNTSATVKSASWMLPSRTQWETMGATSISYETLRNGFTSVGGDNLERDYYWSSTEYENDTSEAWTFLFNNGSWEEYFKSMNFILVRACLAF